MNKVEKIYEEYSDAWYKNKNCVLSLEYEYYDEIDKKKKEVLMYFNNPLELLDFLRWFECCHLFIKAKREFEGKSFRFYLVINSTRILDKPMDCSKED